MNNVQNTKQQQAAIDKLSRLKVGALFMGMGTGKTKTALELMALKKSKCDYMLWLCPCSLKKEIETEKEKWHPELDIDIEGIESIGQSERIFEETQEKMRGRQCFLVVDESLKIKNINSSRTQRVLELGKSAKYKLILNGTPLSKNIVDMYTQMEFLSPLILNMSYQQFKDCYTTYYTEGKMRGVVKDQVNVDHLISKIQPYIYDADLVLETEKIYKPDCYYSMNGEEKEEYEAIKREAYLDWIEAGNDEEDMDLLGLMARLQSFYTQCEDKKERLNDLIDSIDGKVVVFVKYLDTVPDNALKIVGEMNLEKRVEAIKEFENNPQEKVLYVTYGCGAFGLNLQFCHNVIFAEHSFDYAARIQAEARVYRIGQTEDVNYFNLRCDCGLEEMIIDNQTKKKGMLSGVKKEIKRSKKGVKSILDMI